MKKETSVGRAPDAKEQELAQKNPGENLDFDSLLNHDSPALFDVVFNSYMEIMAPSLKLDQSVKGGDEPFSGEPFSDDSRLLAPRDTRGTTDNDDTNDDLYKVALKDKTGFSFPSPFDTSLGSDFTNSSCLTFFNSFLSNDSFIHCYPMSFYLMNSQSYVDLVRDGEDSLNYLLNVSCAVDTSNCQTLMNSLAIDLIADSNCGYDYSLQNQLVIEAYGDFVSYTLAKETTCLSLASGSSSSSSKSASSSNSSSSSSNTTYCYPKALYDSTNVADAYLYLLAVGGTYPNTSTPSCDSCTKRVMDILYESASNSSLPISGTYNSAASVINSNCGANYVHTVSLSASSSSSSSSNSAASALLLDQTSAIAQFLVAPLVIAFLMHFSF